MQIVSIFRAKIVDISPKLFTIEATGSEDKVNALINILKGVWNKRNGANRNCCPYPELPKPNKLLSPNKGGLKEVPVNAGGNKGIFQQLKYENSF